MMKNKHNTMKNSIIIFSLDDDQDMQSIDYFKLFDWKKCIDLICEKNIQNAKFGLSEDWVMTSATGLKDGRPFNGLDGSLIGTYLGSWWATPCIIDIDTLKEYPCFKEIDEKSFSIEHMKAAEDWWPHEAAEYFAEKKFGDI